MPDSSTRFPRRVPASVTVIVPVRNGAHTIGAQLDALQEQSYAGRFDILVADNGSSDDLAGLLARRQGQGRVPVGYVLADELPGASHARNVGARHATGEFIAYCDADDVVREHWLHHLVMAAGYADLVSGSLDTSMINSPKDHMRRPFQGSIRRRTLFV
ncbi:glycosyltransferase family A protein [Rhodococcoides navarretei]|uniref:Glycosyltransferase family A protein n=1 Tax=Rhodococcus navarretei TaxID=3128981 RepID=A0ABU9CYX5_9NOCA